MSYHFILTLHSSPPLQHSRLHCAALKQLPTFSTVGNNLHKNHAGRDIQEQATEETIMLPKAERRF